MHVEEAPPPRRNVSSSVLADWPEVIARELENEAPSDAEEEKDDEPSPKARRSSPSSTDKKRNREQVKEEAADDDDAKDQKGERKKLPRPEGRQPCPRCSSNDTKFCYYNNYNIKQPRFYCKVCASGGPRETLTIACKRYASLAFVTLWQPPLRGEP